MNLGKHQMDLLLAGAFGRLLEAGKFRPVGLVFGDEMQLMGSVDLSYDGDLQRTQKLQDLAKTAQNLRAQAVGIFSLEKLRQKDGQIAEYLVMLFMGQGQFPETFGIRLNRGPKGELTAPAGPFPLRVNQKLLPPAWWEASA